MLETKNTPLLQRIAEDLDNLRERSQFRSLETVQGVNLSSNDYLGLATNPRLKEAAVRAVERTRRIGATGSRLLSGNAEEWQDLEADFAKFTGTEAALYFGSGYAANVGLLSSILKPEDIVFSDAMNHASIIDGIRLSSARRVIYPHADLHFLECSLREHQGGTGAHVIVTESVFSMEGDVAPLADLFALARKYAAEVVVDEAHSIGVLGPEGRGVVAENRLERQALAIIYPCGKALASAGAFVCGAANLKHYLVNHARTFIFSTAMPPYLAGQIRAALDLARGADSERTHLSQIANSLRELLSASGLNFRASSTQIVPVYLGSNEAALEIAAKLQESDFAVKAVRPPTVPAGTARIRLSLTSRITANDIHRLASVIGEACKFLPQKHADATVHA